MLSKLSRAAGLGSDPATQQEAENYKLQVTAGPTYDEKDHEIVYVNTGKPVFVENEFVRAKIVVQVQGFRGVPLGSPSTSDYFNHPKHEKDQYSLAFSFVPKQDLPSADTVWGNDLDHPVRNRLPPGFNTAFRIVKEFIDPGLSCDVYADEPWLYGPSLSCWFALRVGDEVAEDQDFPAPEVVLEGSDGTGQGVRDKLQVPEDNEKRRKFFLDANHRKSFVFEKGRLYQGDFYNPYIDFSNFSLKLPGFSLKVLKYIGEKTHCLRYVFKNRDTGDLYFNINFKLLWGEQLEKALHQGEDQASTEVKGDGGTLDAPNGNTSGSQSLQASNDHSMPPGSENDRPFGTTAEVTSPVVNDKRAVEQEGTANDTSGEGIHNEAVEEMLRHTYSGTKK